ncbi:MAG TPA: FKBP-type peptidyl-prolyl cis-trans isomerase [Jatrophihabitans sp.]|nr:FKBP-type peptidyl-prolyl cis-trans isomerase [Jatrophihabitans sp.]
MPTNQQRREAERRRLQRQLEERRAREAVRKRRTLIGSIVGTVVLIAVVVVIVVVVTSGGSGKKTNNANHQPSTSRSTSPAPTSSSPVANLPTPTKPCASAPKGNKVTFKGVTISGATDLKHAPTVKSVSQHAPTTLQCMDLVVGKGKPASPTANVQVQYDGVLYQNGTEFNSSWRDNGGKPVSFSLNGVIPGFTQGIGGAGKAAPMREGGRRIMILPSALAYAGNPPQGSNIPVDAPLVFIVDLKSVS